MSLPQENHPFDEWFARHERESETPMSRSKAAAVWNALLDGAVEKVWIEKDQFVFDREYESALVALEVKELLGRLKSSPAAPPAT